MLNTEQRYEKQAIRSAVLRFMLFLEPFYRLVQRLVRLDDIIGPPKILVIERSDVIREHLVFVESHLSRNILSLIHI